MKPMSLSKNKTAKFSLRPSLLSERRTTGIAERKETFRATFRLRGRNRPKSERPVNRNFLLPLLSDFLLEEALRKRAAQKLRSKLGVVNPPPQKFFTARNREIPLKIRNFRGFATFPAKKFSPRFSLFSASGHFPFLGSRGPIFSQEIKPRVTIFPC